ncbi:hypothetical protein [Saccharothrix sp. HUAS TT1]|uniref:hypothetical protein n=1 Tax=unclassified Saccharothrix TaxID=2593673 RepID=UPI00345B98AF
MDQAILEPAELDTLISDLEARISEVRLVTPAEPMAFSEVQCSNLLCSILSYCDGDGGDGGK